mmetsp:Transcript_31479/g.66216  ORF Transcript_31479/g.66216 Transcript_31479/m.66216 type:complete len:373 (+) Transcript_31479:85-1203(+)
MGTKILWRPSQRKHENDTATDSTTTTIKQKHAEEELEFHRIRNLRRIDDILKDQNNNAHDDENTPSLIITTPPQRPLIEIINQSLVVGQEVALTVILLAVHREIVIQESQERSDQQQELDMSNDNGLVDYFTQKSSLAMMTVYATLIIIVYYNRQSSARNQQHQERRKRAIVRLSDGLLLAAMLRFLSGVLRTLTASYSTDTVYTLAISGMVIHLLAADYRYADGESSVDVVDGISSLNNSLSVHPRPPFWGGAVSLNAAFFSTVLLVSRIKSNATSYAFVSSVVTLFAFYPASRHNIAGSYPNTIRGSPCFIITFALSIAAWLLISSFERILFASMQLLIFVMSPCLQWRLQRHKQIITGPWDIAHIHIPT